MKASLKCITTKQSVSIWSVYLSILILMYSVLSVAKAIKSDLSFGISVCISIDSSNDLRFVSIHLQCFHNRLISHFSSYCYIACKLWRNWFYFESMEISLFIMRNSLSSCLIIILQKKLNNSEMAAISKWVGNYSPFPEHIDNIVGNIAIAFEIVDELNWMVAFLVECAARYAHTFLPHFRVDSWVAVIAGI